MPYESTGMGDNTREVFIPHGALWGPETALAKELYHTTGYRTPPQFIAAIALVKKAAARTHKQLGVLEHDIAEVIELVANEIMDGMHDDQFPLDVLNSGAGTSLHMNVNEVIARRANELWTSKARGLRINAHDHVNMGQSTNDVLPTAARIACARSTRELVQEMVALREDLQKLAQKFWDIKTSGRTHLRDALPIRWGQRLLADVEHIDAATRAIQGAHLAFYPLWIGGTAVGTKANAVRGYRRLVVLWIAELTGMSFRQSVHTYASGTFQADFLQLAGALRMLAVQLKNLMRKLKLASSGPNTALAEIILPVVHPGSSIMPGKVNPSVLENVEMACLLTEGNAYIVEQATKETDFDLNIYIPLIAWKLLESLSVQIQALRLLRAHCLKDIRADIEICRVMYENTHAWITLLAPLVGYDNAAELSALLSKEKRENETVLHALVRLAKKKRIVLPDGSPVTKERLERLAFPNLD